MKQCLEIVFTVSMEDIKCGRSMGWTCLKIDSFDAMLDSFNAMLDLFDTGLI